MRYPLVMSLVVVAVLVVVALGRSPGSRAEFLRRAGAVVMGVFVVLGGLFAAGEALADPGGWAAVGIVLAWGGALVLLGALAWWRPAAATVVLSALTAVVVVLVAWDARGEGGGALHGSGGPNDALAVFVIGAALAVLGVRRTLPAALLMLVLGIVPVLVQAVSRGGGGHTLGGSLGAASIPTVTVGALYLASVAFTHRAHRPAEVPPDPGPPRHPRHA